MIRILTPLALIALTACQVSKDEQNDSVTVAYNEDVAEEAAADVAATASNVADTIGDDAGREAAKVADKIGDDKVTIETDTNSN